MRSRSTGCTTPSPRTSLERSARPAEPPTRSSATSPTRLPSTSSVHSVGPGFLPVERHAELAPEVITDYVASVPAGRIGGPEDIAHAVSFIASEGASFVTGQRLVVDGGRGVP